MTDTVIKCDSVYKIFGVNAKKMLREANGHVDAKTFWKQMRTLEISHILTDRPTSMSQGVASVDSAIKELAGVGCLVHLKEIQTQWRTSRTLSSLGSGQLQFDVWHLDAAACLYDKNN